MVFDMEHQPNPFMRSTGSPPKKFVGRTEELKELKRALDYTISGTPEHTIFFGPFGIGKTSLLIEFQKRIENANTVFIRLYKTDNITEICDVILRESRFQLGFKENLTKKLRKNLTQVGFTLLGAGASLTLGKVEMNPQSAFKELISSIYDCLTKGSIFILMIDDIHRITGKEGDGAATILSVLSNVLLTLNQEEKRIMFVGTGSYDIFNQLRSYDESSVRVFHPHEIKPLTSEEIIKVIVESTRESKVEFSKEVIQKIYELSEGNPYYVQILAYYAFEKQANKNVTMESFKVAFQKALNELALKDFRKMYDDMSLGARKILATMAESTKRNLRYSELQEGSQGIITSYLDELIKGNAIVREQRGSYRLRDKLFTQYLRTFKPYLQDGAKEID